MVAKGKERKGREMGKELEKTPPTHTHTHIELVVTAL